ncbi:MAG: tRNA CCA-pyrophosphorylase [Planctomycetaceae bacterium]|nr:MAG: tRNA CCA-pyrophosphorylase [Planctomycetaceae bacterium]
METFILIPGRTSDQGCGISEGKAHARYQREINSVQMNQDDMQRLQIREGDRIKLTSAWGSAEAVVVAAKRDELPPGLLFVAYGEISCRLMGADTHGSGMPTSKGIDVELSVLRVSSEGT